MRHEIDLSGWATPMREAAARARDLTPAHREIGELLLGVVQENFITSGGPDPWPPLSEATLLQRARGRTGHNKVHKQPMKGVKTRQYTKAASAAMEEAKPLIFTGKLLRSMTYLAGDTFVDIGSNLPQAARLFFGSRAGVTPVTPARNPFGLTPEHERQILSIYENHLLSSVVAK